MQIELKGKPDSLVKNIQYLSFHQFHVPSVLQNYHQIYISMDLYSNKYQQKISLSGGPCNMQILLLSEIQAFKLKIL